MDQLYDKERISSMFAAIEDSPLQLEAMIRCVLERLASNEDVDKNDLNEILVWVAYSKRPLLIAELCIILKQRTGQPYDALEERLRGRFASLFKLSRTTTSDDFQEDEALNATAVREDISFDIDLFSEDEDIADDSAEIAECNSDEAESDEGNRLNESTLARFWKIEVRFTYASIRDFLVKNRSSRDISMAVKTQDADLHPGFHVHPKYPGLGRLYSGFRHYLILCKVFYGPYDVHRTAQYQSERQTTSHSPTLSHFLRRGWNSKTHHCHPAGLQQGTPYLV
jgi:hypothetical protein